MTHDPLLLSSSAAAAADHGASAQLDPLHQFMVQPLVQLQWGWLNMTLTNAAVFMLVSVLTLGLWFSWAFRKMESVPSTGQALAEMPLSFVRHLVQENLGSDGIVFFSLILTIFLFVGMGNVIGLLPLSFTFTSQIIINFALAFMILTIITVYGFMRHGLHFLRLFYPEGIPWWVGLILVPIELISYLSRPVSLAVRLFANMVAGHSMLKIFAYFAATTGILGIVPGLVNTGLLAFEVLVAFLQAYVFAMLCCIYLKDAVHLH
jgi:F-type H+-transporting ATPase subunit a